jgi:O-antigen ligase
MGGKLVNMWRPVWAGSSLRTWMVLGVPYLLMMALALPGLALARKHPPPDSPAVIVLYALILFYVMGHTIFYSMIRERQYIEPFLIAFAGYTLSLLLKRREGIPVP